MKTLEQHINEGTLIRDAWKGTDRLGRETACLLAAIYPPCGTEESASACPADIMPSWLANLTPSIDDNGSVEAWPGMVRRYSKLANLWNSLSDSQWLRIQYKFRKECVLEAIKHTDNNEVLLVCKQVITFIYSVIESGEINESAQSAAWSEAQSAAESAAESEAQSAAESAAWSAAWSAARSAYGSAAWYAARSAARSAYEYAAESVAWSAAWDRLTVKLFEAIECELGDK